MIFSNFKNVINSIFRNLINSESFTWTSLPICKASYNTIGKKTRQYISDWELVHILRVFIFVESIIKCEIGVFYKLGNPINFIHRLMNNNFRVASTYSVDFTTLILLIKKRPFPNTNADAHGLGTHMIKCSSNLIFLFINENVKINVCFISSLSFIFLLAISFQLFFF